MDPGPEPPAASWLRSLFHSVLLCKRTSLMTEVQGDFMGFHQKHNSVFNRKVSLPGRLYRRSRCRCWRRSCKNGAFAATPEQNNSCWKNVMPNGSQHLQFAWEHFATFILFPPDFCGLAAVSAWFVPESCIDGAWQATFAECAPGALFANCLAAASLDLLSAS